MKFIIATLAATASALPWEKEVKCGFDAACGFDVVIDEATGCGFDAIKFGESVSKYDPDDGANNRGGNSGCSGCAACKKSGGKCEGCSGGCPSGGCDQGSGCRNGSCGNAGNGGNDWCIGGSDCETSPDMVCGGKACDSWCPNNAVECILDALPDDFSPCCADELPGGFGPGSKARQMVLNAINGACKWKGSTRDWCWTGRPYRSTHKSRCLPSTLERNLGKGWADGCCGCFCNFGCNCDCSGNCGPCGCSSCSGNCNVDGSTSGASPVLDTDSAEWSESEVGDAGDEKKYVSSSVGGHFIDYARHYREAQHKSYSSAAVLEQMYGSARGEVLAGSYSTVYIPTSGGFGSGGYSYYGDAQCGFDQKSQQWVDVKCGFDNNCGFDFECGFDAECGFDVVKDTKCGFDLVREQLGCGFDAKSGQFVNVQCGFDNNCGFDIKA